MIGFNFTNARGIFFLADLPGPVLHLISLLLGPKFTAMGGTIGGDGRANAGARDTVSLLMVAPSLLGSNPLLA